MGKLTWIYYSNGQIWRLLCLESFHKPESSHLYHGDKKWVWTDGQTDGWTDRQMEGWMDGWTELDRTNGLTEGLTH